MTDKQCAHSDPFGADPDVALKKVLTHSTTLLCEDE
jgi:hypothetical protein